MLLALLRLLARRDRWLATAVLLAALMVSATEIVGIGAVFAYVRVVADPPLISQSEYLVEARAWLGIDEARFLTVAGLALIAVIVLRNAIVAAATTLRVWFGQRLTQRFATRRMGHYLRRDYETFLTLNTASLRKNLIVEVSEVAIGYLMSGLDVFACALTGSLILALLAAQQPLVTLAALIVLGILYAGVYALIRHRAGRLGHAGRAAHEALFVTADEAFRGIKEIKLQGSEDYFTELFAKAARRLARIATGKALISQLPRYLIETVVFVGLLAVVLTTLSSGSTSGETIALIALFGMAGYRLVPLLSQIFAAVGKMHSTGALVESFIAEFGALPAPRRADGALAFHRAIALEALGYRYPATEAYALHDISLRIARGQSVAFVGATGAGKSTLIELIMGLLPPTTGRILIDDRVLDRTSAQGWQNLVAYVPQRVHYLDDTIARNIAFGIPAPDLDMAAVIDAATRALLHEFIVGELPEGYATRIGEAGARLSGGQLQRLAIARALYRRPTLLVLDEATSALDTVTESAVTETIRGLAGSLTTITIAHRLSTVSHCNLIFILEHGRLVAQGSYEHLIDRSSAFRAMAG
ncbi:MAG: ABC transporter ATP-binding protein [Alphaproteobacteria bacterium]|nr:ABC transporter ATP-binding protein [Alphaproteobacteria bacterium]